MRRQILFLEGTDKISQAYHLLLIQIPIYRITDGRRTELKGMYKMNLSSPKRLHGKRTKYVCLNNRNSALQASQLHL